MNNNSFVIILLSLGLLSQSVSSFLLYRRISALEENWLSFLKSLLSCLGGDSNEDIPISDQN